MEKSCQVQMRQKQAKYEACKCLLSQSSCSREFIFPCKEISKKHKRTEMCKPLSGDKCHQGKSKEKAESAEGGGLFSVGWPRSIFLKMWLLNRDLSEVKNRATCSPVRSIAARANNGSAKVRDGSCLGCSRSSRVGGGHSERGQWRGGLWAEDVISLLLGEETSGGTGLNRKTSRCFLPWSRGETIGAWGKAAVVEEWRHVGGTCWNFYIFWR